MLTVLVLVANAESQSLLDDALSSAARETLGSDALVEVRDVRTLPEDAEAEARARSADAGAIVEIGWRDAARRNAIIHVRILDAPEGWMEREIGFAKTDAEGEKGRMLGYALASMIPMSEKPSAPASATRPATPAALRVDPVTPLARRWVAALEISGVAAQAFGGYGGGVGGTMGGAWYFSRHFSVRAAVGARAAEVGAAQALLHSFTTAAGLAWRSEDATLSLRFGLGAHVDMMMIDESVTHLSPDDPSAVRKSYWLPGGDILLEASGLLTEGAAAVLAVGAEGFFGTAHVYVHETPVASLVPLHLVAEVGLRARF